MCFLIFKSFSTWLKANLVLKFFLSDIKFSWFFVTQINNFAKIFLNVEGLNILWKAKIYFKIWHNWFCLHFVVYWAIWTISKPLNLTEAVRGTFWFVRTWDYQFNMQSFIYKKPGLMFKSNAPKSSPTDDIVRPLN